MKALALVLAMVPQVGWTLSCMESDLARDFLSADAREESIVILMGSISLDRDDYVVTTTGETDFEGNEAEIWSYPARFSGAYLTEDGFRFGFTTALTVSTCQGTWCVGPPNDAERIYFVQQTEDGLTYFPEICVADRSPTSENRRILERCMAGEGCRSAY